MHKIRIKMAEVCPKIRVKRLFDQELAKIGGNNHDIRPKFYTARFYTAKLRNLRHCPREFTA